MKDVVGTKVINSLGKRKVSKKIEEPKGVRVFSKKGEEGALLIDRSANQIIGGIIEKH